MDAAAAADVLLQQFLVLTFQLRCATVAILAVCTVITVAFYFSIRTYDTSAYTLQYTQSHLSVTTPPTELDFQSGAGRWQCSLFFFSLAQR